MGRAGKRSLRLLAPGTVLESARLSLAGKWTWLVHGETCPCAEPQVGPSQQPPLQQPFFFKSNVAWKSLLQQLPLKPIVSSAPLTCQLLAAADGANTPWRAAIQFKDHLPCTDSLRAGPAPDFTKSRRESQGAV